MRRHGLAAFYTATASAFAERLSTGTKVSPKYLGAYAMVVIIALLGSIFLMLQMIGIGLTLWVGAAIAPQWWATAQTYHQMCNQIKDRQWDDTVMTASII